MANPTLPPALNACPDETVAPKSPVQLAITRVSAATPVVASNVGHHIVRNSDFVAAAFQKTPENAHVAICSMLGDPTSGKWYAMNAGAIDLQSPPDRNNYVNSSCFYADEKGNVHARKENFAAFNVLMLDDVGTKVSWSRLRGFPPSYVTQTSPGNYQVGYFLAEPLTDIDYATQLKNAVIEAGLCDPGATGVARWARLPVGINGKPKYKSESGEPSRCRLVRWNPERRYTVDEIVEGLGLKLGATAAPQANVQADAIEHNSGALGTAPECATLDAAGYQTLVSLLENLSSNLPYHDWVRVLMAVHHETGGSVRGLALADKWCSKGQKYPGSKAIEAKWKSFEGYSGKPIAIGTLKKMVREAGTGVDGIVNIPETLHPVTVVAAEPTVAAGEVIPSTILNTHPLGKYSLLGSSAEIAKEVSDQVYVFGEVALQGQATAIYAEPGTGKTLLSMFFAIEGVVQGRIDPAKFFYVNCDDTASGLSCKLQLAEKHGFHMLAGGYKGFKASMLVDILVSLIQTGQAKGVIVVLDTLKKFTNLMDKNSASRFTAIARAFVMRGGSIIALAHTNKKRDPHGKPIPGGTSDIRDDFDAVYILDMVLQPPGTNPRVVTFTNVKARGDNVPSVSYSYSAERGLPYNETVASVQEVDAGQLQPAQVDSDAPIIAAISACISEGIVTKMDLAEAASKRAAVSNRAALRTIEKYTGNDASVHRWAFVLQGHGAKVFQLLQGTLPVAPSATIPESQTLQAGGAIVVSDALAVERDLDMQHHIEILELSDRLLGITHTPGSEADEY